MMKENSLLKAIPLLHKFYEEKNVVLFLTNCIFGTFLSAFFGLGLLVIYIGYIFYKKAVFQLALEYGFDENDIKNYGLEEFVLSDIKENNENELKNNLHKAKNFLEKLLLFTDGCQLFIKSFEIYQNIFKSLEAFGNMNNEEWNTFRENEI